MNPKKGKRELINKANSNMVAVTAVGAFLIVFSLVATRTLWVQSSYKAKVIKKKEAAVKQLEENKAAVEKLKVTYTTFNDTPNNIIGGNPKGSGDRDGDNAKIVLDALPSKYDFPAFITSIKKLLQTKNLALQNISGTDDEVAQSSAKESKVTDIPFTFTSEVGNYKQVRDLLDATHQSIRPIKISKLTITGGDSGKLQLSVDAISYYQGSKGLTIKKEVVQQGKSSGSSSTKNSKDTKK